MPRIFTMKYLRHLAQLGLLPQGEMAQLEFDIAFENELEEASCFDLLMEEDDEHNASLDVTAGHGEAVDGPATEKKERSSAADLMAIVEAHRSRR